MAVFTTLDRMAKTGIGCPLHRGIDFLQGHREEQEFSSWGSRQDRVHTDGHLRMASLGVDELWWRLDMGSR